MTMKRYVADLFAVSILGLMMVACGMPCNSDEVCSQLNIGGLPLGLVCNEAIPDPNGLFNGTCRLPGEAGTHLTG